MRQKHKSKKVKQIVQIMEYMQLSIGLTYNVCVAAGVLTLIYCLVATFLV